mmetsp:Transcript_12345/g.23137  ORF Transcript_12345/g.23137 Transcript_12345/m.23137 type:complete len:257 (+) Transcript_12345:33-803(+)
MTTVNTKHQLNTEYNVTNTTALAMIATTMIGTAALTFPFIMMQLRSPLPYMATPKKKVLVALEEISKRKYISYNHHDKNYTPVSNINVYNKNINKNNIHNPLRFFDLGSGDGETVLAAGSAGWKATGIELNSTLWAISSIRRWCSNKFIRSNCNFLWGDMWKYDIRDADAVMIFGVKPLMPKIAKKISKECKSGTFVMSYRFCIPLLGSSASCTLKKFENGSNEISSKGDDEAADFGLLAADLIYDKEEMKIYQLR